MKIEYLKSILGTISELEMRIKLISNKSIIQNSDVKKLELERKKAESDLRYIKKYGDHNQLNNMLSV